MIGAVLLLGLLISWLFKCFYHLEYAHIITGEARFIDWGKLFDINYAWRRLAIPLPWFRKHPSEAQVPQLKALGKKIRVSLLSFYSCILLYILAAIVLHFILSARADSPEYDYTTAAEFDLDSYTEYIPDPKRYSYEDGLQEEYHDNGQLKQRSYFKNGYLEGPGQSWYEDGTLRSESFKHKGITNGRSKMYYPNGKLEADIHYRMEISEGPTFLYYSNGQLFEKSIWHNDKPDGPFVQYYTNGHLKEAGNFKEGKKEGRFLYFNKDGELEREIKYHDNKKAD